MKKTKKVLSFLISFFLIIGLINTPPIYAKTNSSVDIDISALDGNLEVYEMTVIVTASDPVKQFELVLSYDNSQLKAASSFDKSAIEVSDGDNQNNNPKLKSHATNPVKKKLGGEIYTKAIAAYVDGQRTAIYYAFVSNTGVVTSNTVMFQSYFKLVRDTEESNFNVQTFKIEKDQSGDGFMSRCLASSDRYGVRIGYGGEPDVFDNYDGDSDPLSLTFDYPNLDKKTITGSDNYDGDFDPIKPIELQYSQTMTKQERLQKTIALQIGNYGAASDGNLIYIDSDNKDVCPYIDENNRTMVPLRFIAEQFGTSVYWNEKDQKVKIVSGNKMIIMTIGSKSYKTNDVLAIMDTAPILKKGWNRTMVPIRFVTEALGMAVAWDGEHSLVVITDPDVPWQLNGQAEQEATDSILLVISPLIENSR